MFYRSVINLIHNGIWWSEWNNENLWIFHKITVWGYRQQRWGEKMINNSSNWRIIKKRIKKEEEKKNYKLFYLVIIYIQLSFLRSWYYRDILFCILRIRQKYLVLRLYNEKLKESKELNFFHWIMLLWKIFKFLFLHHNPMAVICQS